LQCHERFKIALSQASACLSHAFVKRRLRINLRHFQCFSFEMLNRNSFYFLHLLLEALCVKISSSVQARRQDLVAGRAKNQKGCPHFKNTVLDVCSNRGPNVKWGAPILNGGAGHHWPPRWRRPCISDSREIILLCCKDAPKKYSKI